MFRGRGSRYRGRGTSRGGHRDEHFDDHFVPKSQENDRYERSADREPPRSNNRQGRGAAQRRTEGFRERANERTEQARFKIEDAKKAGVKEPGLMIQKFVIPVPVYLRRPTIFVGEFYDHLINVVPEFGQRIARATFVHCIFNIMHAKLVFAHRKAFDFPLTPGVVRVMAGSEWLSQIAQRASLLPAPIAGLVSTLGNFEHEGMHFLPVLDLVQDPDGLGYQEDINQGLAHLRQVPDDPPVSWVSHPLGARPLVPLQADDHAWSIFFQAMHWLRRIDGCTEVDIRSGEGTPAQAVQLDFLSGEAWSTYNFGSYFETSYYAYGEAREMDAFPHLQLSAVRMPNVIGSPYSAQISPRTRILQAFNAYSLGLRTT